MDTHQKEHEIRAAAVAKFGCSPSDPQVFYNTTEQWWSVRFDREAIAEDADETWYRITGFRNDKTEIEFVAVKNNDGYDFE